MKTRNFALTISALALAASSFAASADVLFTNLGTAAPPASVGSHAVTPFDTAAQAAVSEYSNVSIIPGSPVAGDLTISPAANKRTVPTGWGSSWSHGYTGPVFFISGSGSATLTLPPNTKAFYFYLRFEHGNRDNRFRRDIGYGIGDNQSAGGCRWRRWLRIPQHGR